MRIVGGKYRHRIISWPDDQTHTRPTKDRVREAVFSAVGDISGKVVSLTRVVTMDKEAPSITENNVNETSLTKATVSSKTWYGTKSIPVSITASDGAGTGVTSVEYAIGSNADSADWKPLANTGLSFEGNIQFTTDGAQTYYVRAKDVAGNVTAVSNRSAKTVYIDSTAPNLPVLAKVDNQTLIGAKLTNKQNDILTLTSFLEAVLPSFTVYR